MMFYFSSLQDVVVLCGLQSMELCMIPDALILYSVSVHMCICIREFPSARSS